MVIKIKQFTLFVGDIILLYAALFLTIYVRYGHVTTYLVNAHLIPFSIIFIIWIGLFYAAGWYDIQTIRNRFSLAQIIAATLIVGLSLAVIVFYLVPYFHISPKRNLVIFTAFFAIFAFLWRLIVAAIIKTPRQKVLLIGSSADADELCAHLEENPHLGYKIQIRLPRPSPAELKSLGDLIARESIGTIVLLGEEQTKNHVTASLYKNLSAGIEIVPFVDFYEMIFNKVPLGELREEWFLENISRRHRAYNAVKRTIDIAAGLCVGFVFIILWPFAYCATKCSSPGPFIFSQTRVGKNGKTFTLYKIRTMRHDSNHRWPTHDDQRITAMGKLLRATHIDELPQAWNILRGDISLIGPRPDFIDFFKTLEEQISYYAIRTLVKPGVTGWAQTNYPITASLEETRVRLSYDLYYLKHYSLALDTLIALKTLKTMLTAAGR